MPSAVSGLMKHEAPSAAAVPSSLAGGGNEMSQPPEPSSSKTFKISSQEFSSEERAFLLELAHQSVETAAGGDKLAAPLPPNSHLTEPRGIFTTLYQLAAMQHRMYPCEPPSTDWNRILIERLGQVPPPLANDGIVPFRSQLWGKLIWAGQGDHLDVVGHFAGTRRSDDHVDWLSSGAKFDLRRFDSLLDAVAHGILDAGDG